MVTGNAEFHADRLRISSDRLRISSDRLRIAVNICTSFGKFLKGSRQMLWYLYKNLKVWWLVATICDLFVD
jgi:hypothetical protein